MSAGRTNKTRFYRSSPKLGGEIERIFERKKWTPSR